jgi:hypothetical protein
LVIAYRLHQHRYQPDASSGIEARGNRRGETVLYAAASVAGAMVEILVHYAGVPKGMSLSRIEVPDDVSTTEPPLHLLKGD